MTLQQYIVRKKMTEVKKLLVLAEWTVKEVCYQVGYLRRRILLKTSSR